MSAESETTTVNPYLIAQISTVNYNTKSLNGMGAEVNRNTVLLASVNVSLMHVNNAIVQLTQVEIQIAMAQTEKKLADRATELSKIQTAGPVDVTDPTKMISPDIHKADKASKTLFSGMAKSMTSMAGLSLVLNPMMSAVEGILEPFSIFTESFGAIGTILGAYLYPILIPLNSLALIVLPPLSAGLSTWNQLMANAGGLFGILGDAWRSGMGVIGPGLSQISLMFTSIGPAFSGFGNQLSIVSAIVNGINFTSIGAGIMTWIVGFQDFGNWIRSYFATLVSQMGTDLSNKWNDLGTQLTGGGSDKKGWW